MTRFLRTVSTRRLLATIAGLVTAVAAGTAIALAAAGTGPVPAKRPLAGAIRTALGAPAVPGITARISFTNHLIASSNIEGSDPILTGATGRLWLSPSSHRMRLELQSDNGDAQVVVNNGSFWVYDPSAHTVYEGALPAHRAKTHSAAMDKQAIPSVTQIQTGLNRLSRRVDLSGAIPSDVAGHAAYTIRVSPKHDGGLLGAAEMAWDATRGIPLRIAVYARGESAPVLELKATDISYGQVPTSDFAAAPPPTAKVVKVQTPAAGLHRSMAAKARALKHHAHEISGVAAVAGRLPFKLTAPRSLVGLQRRSVSLLNWKGSPAALVTYGQNLGGIAVIEQTAQTGASASAQNGDHHRGLSLPTVSINGATAQELDTALGTMVRFTRGGVGYTVLGSVPPVAADQAARVAMSPWPHGPVPLEVRGLVKRYGELTAVAGVDVTVNSGDVYGYLGPNGAGKTTSLRMMLGLIRPTAGTVRLFGQDPTASVKALQGVAGFVEAPTFYPYLTARRNLELLASYDGHDARGRVGEALDAVELADRARDRVGGYSHGMRQRLGIAAALLRDPKLLLLDEPATGLDPAGMRDMRLLIRRLADQGITVVLSSHLLAEVEEVCNRVAIVRKGRIVYEGAIADLKRGAGTSYRLETTNDERAVEVCRAQRGISEVRLVHERITFTADEPAVTELSQALVEAGALIKALAPQTVTLEDLFFSLTEGAEPADGAAPKPEPAAPVEAG